MSKEEMQKKLDDIVRSEKFEGDICHYIDYYCGDHSLGR